MTQKLQLTKHEWSMQIQMKREFCRVASLSTEVGVTLSLAPDKGDYTMANLCHTQF